MTEKGISVAALLGAFEAREGRLFWKSPGHGRRIGRPCGHMNSEGYMVVVLEGVSLRQHRVIFAMAHGRWPEGEIDHVNMRRDDNRPENLREATMSQNRCNCTARSNNTSGAKGVFFHGGKWRSRIKVNKQTIYLGRHSDFELAKFIYECAARKYHGEFSRSST
jgi:hypothetical protein